MRRQFTMRRRVLEVSLFVGLCVLANSCGQKILVPRTARGQAPAETLGTWTQVDYPINWSQDGRFFAFRRVVNSSIGPPGLYVAGRFGRSMHYVMPANIFSPNRVSFSPDGRYLAGTAWNGDGPYQVFIADLLSGRVRWPDYQQMGVWDVDWSPDGATLVLSGEGYTQDVPLDSCGIHLFELRTGRDRPFYWRGHHILGGYARWSPDGRSIALDEYFTFRVVVYGIVDSSISVVWQGHPGDWLEDVQWLGTGVFGRLQVAFTKRPGLDMASYVADPDGGGVVRLPYLISDARFAPSRPELLTSDMYGPDTLCVIFAYGVSLTGITSKQQLTWWEPAWRVGPMRASPDFDGAGRRVRLHDGGFGAVMVGADSR